MLPEFQKFNAELMGISVDSAVEPLAFAKDRNLHFPLRGGVRGTSEGTSGRVPHHHPDGSTVREMH